LPFGSWMPKVAFIDSVDQLDTVAGTIKGSLTIRSSILFGPLVGTFDIKGVIKTAN